MLRLPHNRKTRIQFALILAFIAAFYFGARATADWLLGDEYFLDMEYAIERGDIDTVRRMLDAGVSPNVRNSITHEVPLHVAVRKKDPAIAELLISRGADLNKIRDLEKQTSLLMAMRSNMKPAPSDRALRDLLLDHGARVDLTDDDGVSPLHLAAREGDFDLVRRVVDLGAPLHGSTRYEEALDTPAMWALGSGHDDIATYLLFEAGKGDFTDEDLDLLLVAATAGSPDLIRRLVEAGADPNAMVTSGPPIRRAIYSGSVETLQTFIDLGASVDGSFWYSAHYLARFPDDFELKAEKVTTLLNAGADINEANDRGETAMHVVAEFGNAHALVFLHLHGADIHAQNFVGSTPLHYAAGSGRVAAVNALIELGAKSDALNDFNERPIDLAKRLLEHGIDNIPVTEETDEIPDPQAIIEILERALSAGDRE